MQLVDALLSNGHPTCNICVLPLHNQCYTDGANNIEKKLNNEIYGLSCRNKKFWKKNGRLYAILEKLIEIKNVAGSPMVQAFNLAVPMPPPEYFTNIQWDGRILITTQDEHHVDEVERVE